MQWQSHHMLRLSPPPQSHICLSAYLPSSRSRPRNRKRRAGRWLQDGPVDRWRRYLAGEGGRAEGPGGGRDHHHALSGRAGGWMGYQICEVSRGPRRGVAWILGCALQSEAVDCGGGGRG